MSRGCPRSASPLTSGTDAAHGPDAETHKKASAAELKPMKVGEGSMAIMFESAYQLATTRWAVL